ncbi:hypothetical protein GCM10011393_15910 [Sphingopyxis bauzanensis]|nr:hypothetical protein GCM10011393_15910 [Sphingopyxis bauzanensis]
MAIVPVRAAPSVAAIEKVNLSVIGRAYGGGVSKSRGIDDPPCREAMGKWQSAGLTERPWRYRRRPSTIRFAGGPSPYGFATGSN